MVDTHCHIQVKDYDEDRDAVLAKAVADGVEAIVVPAIDEPSFDATLAMTACVAPRVVSAIGVHPHHAREVTDSTLARIAQLLERPDVAAVGEIGLDYYYDFAPRDVQQTVFREQVRLAKRAGKPVIVHNRETDEDLLRILQDEQDGSLNGVLHCFSSTTAVLQRALSLGLHVSFTGNITFKNSTLGDVVREVPIDRVMLETDSPWMSPPPWRGKRNEPGRVRMVAEKIAELKGMELTDVINTTTMNAKRFFGMAIALVFLFLGGTAMAQEEHPIPPKPPEQVVDTTVAPAKPDTVIMPSFYRLLGIGGGIGTSTIIPNQGGTSEANLFTSIVQITVMPWRSVGFDLRYWHFLDDKRGPNPRVDTNCPTCDVSDHYNSLDADIRFIFNPRNRVTIGMLFGGTMSLVSRPVFDQSGPPIVRTTGTINSVFEALVVNVNLAFGWGMVQLFGEYRVLEELNADAIIAVPSAGLMYYFPENFSY